MQRIKRIELFFGSTPWVKSKTFKTIRKGQYFPLILWFGSPSLLASYKEWIDPNHYRFIRGAHMCVYVCYVPDFDGIANSQGPQRRR